METRELWEREMDDGTRASLGPERTSMQREPQAQSPWGGNVSGGRTVIPLLSVMFCGPGHGTKFSLMRCREKSLAGAFRKLF